MWSFRLWKEYIDAGEPSDVWPGDLVVGPTCGGTIDTLNLANLNNSIVMPNTYPYVHVHCMRTACYELYDLAYQGM